MHSNKFSIILLIIAMQIVFVGCFSQREEDETVNTEISQVTSGKTIILGDISDDPGEVIEGTQPLADYVADQLSDFGYSEGQVRIARSMGEMSQLLKNGEVDLYFDSVYPATIVSDNSGAELILRRWRYGVSSYQTVIFASSDSGITSIEDLPGHVIAMDAPYSTSGFFLPAVHIVEKGYSLVGKKSYNDPVDDVNIGFVFSYDDENTLQWVLDGSVVAGATDDYHFDTAFSDTISDKLIELARTESVPRQVVVARSGLDPELLQAIRQILITAHETDVGQTALEAFQTSQFDEFPEGIEIAINRMREMMNAVEDIPLP